MGERVGTLPLLVKFRHLGLDFGKERAEGLLAG
jgi:hypothetical protein